MSFRKISDDFIEKNLEEQAIKNPAIVISYVRSWTNGNLDLTNSILQLILKQNLRVESGEERDKVNNFIQEKVIQNQEDSIIENHFKKIRSEILDHPQKTKILIKLHNILEVENSPSDQSIEVQALLSSGIVVAEGGKLKVQNPIYASVFGQEWVEKELNGPMPVPLATLIPWSRLSRSKLRVAFSLIASFLLLAIIPLWYFRLKGHSSIEANGEPSVIHGTVSVLISDDSPLKQRISIGEKILINEEETSKNIRVQDSRAFRKAKEEGVSAFANGNFEEAIKHFENARNYYRNSPEVLIYLNNASVLAEGSNSYSIAVAVPIAGETGDLAAAQAMLRGVAQAQNMVNQFGINGSRLKVAIVDDSGNAELAPDIATGLGETDVFLGVVGHYYSEVTLSAAENYQENELPIISLSSSVELSKLDNDYIFRTSPSDAVTGRTLATHMLDVWGKERVAVYFSSGNPYSESLKGEFVNTILSRGGQVVQEFDWSDLSASSQFTFEQAVERDAQVLMFIPFEPRRISEDIAAIARANFENGKELDLMGGDVVYSIEVLSQEFEDAVIGAFWHIDAADPDSDFIVQSKDLWGAEVNWVTAMAFDATQAWIEALRRSSSPNPTRQSLQRILSSRDFSAPGASDDVKFTQTGDRNISAQLVKVSQFEGGYRFEPIFFRED